MKVAVVKWVDAFIDTDDMFIKDARKLKPVKRYTVGFLVAENKHGVVLSTDYYHAKKKPKEIAAPMFIPWGIVTKFEVFEDG